MSYLSIATYTASGASNAQYAVPFPFIARSHVRVLTGYSEETGAFDTELSPGGGFTWINDTTIEVGALAAGTSLSIVRQTPSDLPLVDWVAGGGALTANELTTSTLQTLYATQESLDRAKASGLLSDVAAADAAEALGTANTALGTANSASTAANTALDTANSASTAASNAVTTANAANTTAGNAVTTANAASTAAGDATTTANQALALIEGEVRTGLRNVIINGGMQIAQAGDGPYTLTQSGSYSYSNTIDKWGIDGNTNSDVTAERIPFPLGQADVPGNPSHFLRIKRDVAATTGGYATLYNGIEGGGLLAGEAVALSFWARSSTASVLPVVNTRALDNTYNIGDSEFDTTFANSVALTEAWSKYQFTATLAQVDPALGLSDSSDGWQALLISLPTLDAFEIDIALVQLELGTEAKPFEFRPNAVELDLCQRYYFETWLWGHGCRGYKYANEARTFAFNGGGAFPTRMRWNPTVVLDTTGTTFDNCSNPTVDATEEAYSIRVNVTGPGWYRAYNGKAKFFANF